MSLVFSRKVPGAWTIPPEGGDSNSQTTFEVLTALITTSEAPKLRN
jgi:hypothetical protein